MKKRHLLPIALLGITAIAMMAQTPSSPAKAAKTAAATPTVPDSLKAELNITYGHTPEQELKMDVYRPKAGGDKLPACVLVHGGGWVGGDKERFTPLAIGLAQRGYVVANIEYRLAPVAKYPAAVQDCLQAVRFVRSEAQRFGLDPNRIGAWGGSAGGHLVAMIAAAPTESKFLTGDLSNVSAKVQATVDMAGPTQLNDEKAIANYRNQKEKSSGFQWIGKLYDDAPDLYREASPITYFSKDTCPILFLSGSLDNPARDAAGMEKLKSLGVPTQQVLIEGGKHGCWLQAPWQEQCLNAVDSFYKTYLK